MAPSALAQVNGISVNRGSSRVLEDVSVSLFSGEVVAVMGENGSGKSTLVEAFAGLLPLRRGEVVWSTFPDGQTLVRDFEGRRNAPPPMGLTLQKGGICGDEIVSQRLMVALLSAGIDPDEITIKKLLSEWGLAHRSEDRVAHLSGGMSRRLSILCGLAPLALSDEPRVALLDEPSEGLDDSAKHLLRRWLRALASNDHGIIVATHDKKISSCADRIIHIESTSVSESSGDPEGEKSELEYSSSFRYQDPIISVIRWSLRIELRNPIETIGRATPAIVALLLSYSLVGEIDLESHDSRLLSALVLAPGFISAISTPAIASRLSESDCGRWWKAIAGPMARPAFSITGASILLPVPLTYLSWAILSGGVDAEVSSEVLRWLWIPALALIDLAIAATALHLLVSDLSRSSAAPASLLLLVLVWPFLELTDALSTIIDHGMEFTFALNDPIPACLIASMISALVWLAAILIPDY